MTTKTYDNIKTYSVLVEVPIGKNRNLTDGISDDPFQLVAHVQSPKTGSWLRDVRLDYLDAHIYNFLTIDQVDGRATLKKIMTGLSKGVRVNAGRWTDKITATVELTAHDMWCCVLADNGWRARQDDYAD